MSDLAGPPSVFSPSPRPRPRTPCCSSTGRPSSPRTTSQGESPHHHYDPHPHPLYSGRLEVTLWTEVGSPEARAEAPSPAVTPWPQPGPRTSCPSTTPRRCCPGQVMCDVWCNNVTMFHDILCRNAAGDAWRSGGVTWSASSAWRPRPPGDLQAAVWGLCQASTGVSDLTKTTLASSLPSAEF